MNLTRDPTPDLGVLKILYRCIFSLIKFIKIIFWGNKNMKKIILSVFTLISLANPLLAEGMVGAKIGIGDLSAEAKSYTAGSNTYAAESKDVDSPYGAVFVEVDIPQKDGLSVGLEYVPFTAHISLDKKESSTGADLDNYTTLYLQYMMKDVAEGSVYVKAGMSQADISAVTNPDSTVVSQDDTIKGIMVGLGFQKEVNGLFGRIEATHTDLDNVSITTTSNGSSSVTKTGSGDITTLSLSIAKSF